MYIQRSNTIVKDIHDLNVLNYSVARYGTIKNKRPFICFISTNSSHLLRDVIMMFPIITAATVI